MITCDSVTTYFCDSLWTAQTTLSLDGDLFALRASGMKAKRAPHSTAHSTQSAKAGNPELRLTARSEQRDLNVTYQLPTLEEKRWPPP